MPFKLKAELIERSIELRKMCGAPADECGEVEFFFYAEKIDKALDLMNTLKNMNYVVECVQREYADNKFLITGNTPTMNMQTKDLLLWTNQMENLAAEFNCMFDGWGAHVQNEEMIGKDPEKDHL